MNLCRIVMSDEIVNATFLIYFQSYGSNAYFQCLCFNNIVNKIFRWKVEKRVKKKRLGR